MSGDHQVLKHSKMLENSQGQKYNKPNTLFVTVNGHKYHSNLNPNALEFVPSYFKNKPQLNLNEELKKSILKDGTDKQNERNISTEIVKGEQKNRIGIENQIVFKDIIEKREHFENRVEIVNPKNKEEQFKDITRVEEIAEIKKPIEDKRNEYCKANQNLGNEEAIEDKGNGNYNEELYTLFTGTSNVIFISSDDTTPSTESNVIENSLFKNEDLKIEIPDIGHNTNEIKQTNKTSKHLKEIANKEIIPIENLNNQNNKKDVHSAKTLRVHENRNDFNKTNFKTSNFSKDQHQNIKVSKEVNNLEEKGIIKTKIGTPSNQSRTGAIKKPNFSSKSQQETKDDKNLNIHKEIKPVKLKSNISTIQKQNIKSNPEHEIIKKLSKPTESKSVKLNSISSTVSNSKLDKSFIKNSKTSLPKSYNSKNQISTANQTFNNAISGVSKRETNSIRSTSSTDKSITSNR